MLLVSHDRAFLDNIVTSTLAFEGEGRVVEYVGGWEDYLRQRPRPRPERGAKSPRESERGWGPASTEKSERGGNKQADVAGNTQRRTTKKLSFKEQREFESLPAQIEALEEEQRRLKEESESADFYKAGGDHIRAVLARIERAAEEHDAALARWLELEERAGARS